jgi:MutS domain III
MFSYPADVKGGAPPPKAQRSQSLSSSQHCDNGCVCTMTTVAILVLNQSLGLGAKTGGGGSSSSSSSSRSSSAAADVNVVVWTSTPRKASAATTASTTTTTTTSCNAVDLAYYHYHDQAIHQFSHTNALLQRLALKQDASSEQLALSAVHVASGLSKKNAMTSSALATTDVNGEFAADPTTKHLLRTIEESLQAAQSSLLAAAAWQQDDESTMDHQANSNAPPPPLLSASSLVHFHDTYKAAPSKQHGAHVVDMGRLSNVMHQLLSEAAATPESTTTTTTTTTAATQAWLQLIGDVAWQQHPEIQAGLVFLLHTAAQWPTVTTPAAFPVALIRKGHLDHVLSLDSTAAEAIHLWPPATVGQQCVTGGTPTNNSIYGVLSSACQTASGKRRLQQWLRQPLVSLEAIVARQDAVQLLVHESVARDAIGQVGLRLFAGKDLTQLAVTLATYATATATATTNTVGTDPSQSDLDKDTGASAGAGAGCQNSRRALVALYDLYLVSSQKIPLLTEQLEMALSNCQAEAATAAAAAPTLLHDILATLQQCQAELARSVDLIEAVLDLDQAPREFLVQADYKEELRDILDELDQVQVELQENHEHMNQLWAEVSGSGSSSNSPAVRLEATSDDGQSSWQYRLPNTNDSKILQHQLASTVTVHKVLKNGVYFTTKALRHLGCQQQDLRAQYDRHQRTVALDAAAVAATYGAVLERASDAVSHLDVLYALAHTAAYSPHGYCRPTLTDSDEDGFGISLTAARHPCVELQESMDFIPNDCNLIFGESSFLLVTGPNSTWVEIAMRLCGWIVALT